MPPKPTNTEDRHFAEAVEKVVSRRMPAGTLAPTELFVQRIRGEAADDLRTALPSLEESFKERVREQVEALDRFGLKEDAEHPGFSEIGYVARGKFLRREQVLAALDSEDHS